MPAPEKLFALTTRGLESISAAELARYSCLSNISQSYRCVCAQFSQFDPGLVELRTVDDLFLELLHLTDVVHTRDMLARIVEQLNEVDCSKALTVLAALRELPSLLTFSVSASFIGQRNYTSTDLKDVVAKGFEGAWGYQEDDRLADLNMRLFIVHQEARVGIRVAKSPLHERDYKKVQQAGSLKPPVAAAMLAIAELKPGDLVLDPFCGAGTILAEAELVGSRCLGGDLDASAVSATIVNSPTANARSVIQWDALRLPISDRTINKVVSNLPWGKQIKISEPLAEFYGRICKELERVVAVDGRLVLLTAHADLLKFDSLKLIKSIEISLFGETPQIVVYG